MVAAEECDEVRPQERALAKCPLRNGHILVVHLMQFVAGAVLAALAQDLVPIPPVIFIRLAVQRPLARDRDIPLRKRIDERGIVEQFRALPARANQREIGLLIPAELYGCPFRQMKVDIAFKMDGPARPVAGRHQHPPATCRMTIGDCFPEGFCTVRESVAGGSISAEVENTRRKNRLLDLRDNFRRTIPGIFRGTIRLCRRERLQNCAIVAHRTSPRVPSKRLVFPGKRPYRTPQYLRDPNSFVWLEATYAT